MAGNRDGAAAAERAEVSPRERGQELGVDRHGEQPALARADPYGLVVHGPVHDVAVAASCKRSMVTALLESHGLIHPIGGAPSWRPMVVVTVAIRSRSASSLRWPCSSEFVTPWPRISSPRARSRRGMSGATS